MEEYKVKQIWPAHADHISHYKTSLIDSYFKESEVVVQRKYDGERMLVHFNHDETYCTSRRCSKKTGRYMENQDKIMNLPHLQNLNYTVIDCEFYGDTWADAVGVLHSLPERAFELQKTTSVKFAVFDCLFFDGEDIREKPYEERLKYVHKILDILNYELNDFRFHFVEQFKVNDVEQAYKIAQDYWNAGYEGVVLKPLNKAYYDVGMMIKIKRTETVDLVVSGYLLGRGKYSNTVGALCAGYYDTASNSIVHVTRVNCGTDEDRAWWKNYFDNNVEDSENIDSYNMLALQKTKVIEVKCQEITDKSLRHPVYLRRRDDKDYKMCTKETIFK